MFVTTGHVDYEGSRIIGMAETFDEAYALFWKNLHSEDLEGYDEFRVTEFVVGEFYPAPKHFEVKWRRDGKGM